MVICSSSLRKLNSVVTWPYFPVEIRSDVPLGRGCMFTMPGTLQNWGGPGKGKEGLEVGFTGYTRTKSQRQATH